MSILKVNEVLTWNGVVEIHEFREQYDKRIMVKVLLESDFVWTYPI